MCWINDQNKMLEFGRRGCVMDNFMFRQTKERKNQNTVVKNELGLDK